LQIFLHNEDFILLIERNLQQKNWATLELRGQGRKQLMRQLREVVLLLLEHVEKD